MLRAKGLQVQDASHEGFRRAALYRMAGPSFVSIGLSTDEKATTPNTARASPPESFPPQLTAIKGEPDTHWLKEADSQMLQQALKDVNRAFDAFFEKRSRFPRFRSRKAGHFTFRIPQRVKLKEGKVYVPKVGCGAHPPIPRPRGHDEERDVQERRLRTLVRCPDY